MSNERAGLPSVSRCWLVQLDLYSLQCHKADSRRIDAKSLDEPTCPDRNFSFDASSTTRSCVLNFYGELFLISFRVFCEASVVRFMCPVVWKTTQITSQYITRLKSPSRIRGKSMVLVLLCSYAHQIYFPEGILIGNFYMGPSWSASNLDVLLFVEIVRFRSIPGHDATSIREGSSRRLLN